MQPLPDYASTDNAKFPGVYILHITTQHSCLCFSSDEFLAAMNFTVFIHCILSTVKIYTKNSTHRIHHKSIAAIEQKQEKKTLTLETHWWFFFLNCGIKQWITIPNKEHKFACLPQKAFSSGAPASMWKLVCLEKTVRGIVESMCVVNFLLHRKIPFHVWKRTINQMHCWDNRLVLWKEWVSKRFI